MEDITKGLSGDKATAKELQLVLRAPKSAVLGITDVVKKHSDDAEVSQKKTREAEDELDEYKQKNLKGKFVITSTKENHLQSRSKMNLLPRIQHLWKTTSSILPVRSMK